MVFQGFSYPSSGDLRILGFFSLVPPLFFLLKDLDSRVSELDMKLIHNYKSDIPKCINLLMNVWTLTSLHWPLGQDSKLGKYSPKVYLNYYSSWYLLYNHDLPFIETRFRQESWLFKTFVVSKFFWREKKNHKWRFLIIGKG